MSTYKYKKITFRHMGTGKMLNLYYTGSIVNGSKICLWAADGSLEQQWYLNGSKLQTMRNTKFVLDRNTTNNVADVWTDSSSEDAAQQIILISSGGGYKIKLTASSHYLAINNAGDGYWVTSSSSAALWEINEMTTSDDIHEGVSSGTYNIINQNGLYLNVTYGTDSNGTSIIVYTQDGSEDQKFRIVNNDNYALLYAMCSGNGRGRVVDAYRPSGEVQNGAKAQIWDATDPKAQHMAIASVGGGYYKIVLKSNSSLALTVNGSSTCFSSYKAASSQKWKFIIAKDSPSLSDTHTPPPIGKYTIVSAKNDGKARNLNVISGKDVNGTSLVMYENDGSTDQKFEIVAGAGSCKLKASCSSSGRVVDAYRPSGAVQSGTKAQIWSPDDDTAQKMIITAKGGNRYKIALASNKTLALTASGTGNMDKVTFSTYIENNTSQLWFFEEILNEKHLPPKAGEFNILSANTSGAATNLNVTSGKDADGISLIMYQPDGSVDQKFKLVNGSSYSTIQASCSSSGRVVDAYRPSGAVQNGTKAQIWTANDPTSQRVIITPKNGYYKISLESNTNLALTAMGHTNVSKCTFSNFVEGNLSQLWKFTEPDSNEITEHTPPIATTYNISCGNGFLNVVYGNDANGTKLLSYEADGTIDQVFKLENKNGSSLIRAMCSSEGNNRVVDALRPLKSGSVADIWDSNDNEAQQMIVSKAADGKYIIALKSHPTLVLTSKGQNSGVQFVNYSGNTSTQHWSFDPVNSWKPSETSSGSGVAPPSGNSLKGIDVSSHQGSINWTSVKNDGVQFAFIRAGIVKDIGDKFKLDSFFHQNIQNAIAQNIPVGVYVYSYIENISSIATAVNLLLAEINQYKSKIKYPVVFDIEDSPSDNVYYSSKTKSFNTQLTAEFCQKIKNAGYIPMWYANASFSTKYIDAKSLVDSGYDLWLAHYGVNQSYYNSSKYTIWQYTEKGSISGINGGVDCNYGYYDYSGNSSSGGNTAGGESNSESTSWGNDLIGYVIDTIIQNESPGNLFASVNAQDTNGKPSLGLFQWNADNLALFNEIKSKDMISYSKLPASLKDGNWANRPLTSDEKTAMSQFISSDAGKQVQVKWAKEKAASFIKHFVINYSVPYGDTIAFLCDLRNQWPVMSDQVGAAILSSKTYDLKSVLAKSKELSSKYSDRRDNTYSFITSTKKYETSCTGIYNGTKYPASPSSGTGSGSGNGSGGGSSSGSSNVGGKPISPPSSISEVNIMTRYNAPIPISGSEYTINNIPDITRKTGFDNATLHCGSGFNQNGEFRNLNGNQVSSAILSFIKSVYGSSYSPSEANYCYFLFGEHDSNYGYHHGVDIQISDGATIKALYGGEVTVANGTDAGFGLVGIYVADLGVTTFYMHMKNISVAVGGIVKDGDPIGQQSGVGAGGRSHLHFEVRAGKQSHASNYTTNVTQKLTSIIPYGYMIK